MATQAAKASAAATASAADNKNTGAKPGKTAPAANEPGATGGDKGRSSKKMLIMLIAGVVLLAGIGAGAWLFVGRHSGDAPSEDAAKPSGAQSAAKGAKKDGEKSAKDEKKKVLEYLSGDPYYTVNLADEDGDRFLQLGLVFEITDQKTSEELKVRMPAVRSAVLLLLSSKHSKELLTVDGKKQLSGEILAIARQTLDASSPDAGVAGVDFSVFVIQ